MNQLPNGSCTAQLVAVIDMRRRGFESGITYFSALKCTSLATT